MDYLSGHVMNLANSIIGVSVLAMPYCFKQCGIILSILILLISNVISRLGCHFLLKSAILARRKTFEFLAFHIFGSLGKFMIEIGIIGFLLGTCIAFFVVIGDLTPEIVSEMTGAYIGGTLRNSSLIALAVFCVLPLGLLRNVNSLNGVSKATIAFYCCLVLKVILEALPHILVGDWVSEVIWWRPAGILQCLPIFSMALFCQTQIFEIYQNLPNASLDKMNSLIRVAVNICTWVYILVGTFGYIAFFQKTFTGNILLSFRPSILSDIMKLGFVLSVAFSFPIAIFPCRASMYSLLYKGPSSYTTLHESNTTNYIPEGKFKLLTLIIVFVSLVIGILIPNIELVLGLMGSTIGVMICMIFPVTCFICISPKNTNERILAQMILFIGVIVMVLGTYANLYAFEEAQLKISTEKPKQEPKFQDIVVKANIVELDKPVLLHIPTTVLEKLIPNENKIKMEDVKPKEVRREPPQPVEPVENPLPPTEIPKISEIKLEPKKEETKKKEVVVEPLHSNEENLKFKEPSKIEEKSNDDQILREKTKEKSRNDELDIGAIKKEETELKEQENENQSENRNQELIDTIQKQNEVQKEIVEQQKKLIEVIQKQQENVNKQEIDKVNEEKLKAVKQIETIARKAIETISAQERKFQTLPDKPPNMSENKSNITKIKENGQKLKKIEMVPLPLAYFAKSNNISNGSSKKSDNMVEDSVNGTKREKRNVPLTNFCEEMKKQTSTEKPMIKMLCHLTEPGAVPVPDSGAMKNDEVMNSIDLKPQKRDLKHSP